MIGEPRGQGGVGRGDHAEVRAHRHVRIPSEVLAAEEHHAPLQQCLADLPDGGGVEGRREIDAAYLRSRVLRERENLEVPRRGSLLGHGAPDESTD